MTTIKVNNQVITIANKKSTESSSIYDIDKESKSLESLAADISKSIEVFSVISNVKAMESFGYKSTEGLGEKIKNGAKFIWEKIKEFFIKLGKWIKDRVLTGGAKTQAASLLKKIEPMDENDIDFDFKINPIELGIKLRFRIDVKSVFSSFTLSIPMIKTLYSEIGALKNIDSDGVDDAMDDIDKAFKDLLSKNQLLSELKDTAMDAAEDFYDTNGRVQKFNENGSLALKMIGLNSKSSIIDFLRSTQSADNIVFKSLREIDKLCGDMNKILSELESKYSNDKGANKMCKMINNVAQLTSKLTKFGWMFTNMVLILISKSLKGKKPSSTK